MDYQKLQEVNERLKPILIERKDKKTGKTISKDYNTVDQRINGFRELFPNGSIQPEILSHERETVNGKTSGVVLMKATAYDEAGTILATGHALEKSPLRTSTPHLISRIAKRPLLVVVSESLVSD